MTTDAEAVVAESPWVVAGSWVVCPVLGGLLGWLVKAIAGWVVALPWAPLRGPLRLLESVDEPGRTLVAIALGVVVGLVFALLWARERLTVTVSRSAVVLERGGTAQRFDDSVVRGAFRDGKQLVLLGTDGTELAREVSEDLEPGNLRVAFQSHGLAWHAEDPYAGQYRIWVPDEPGLDAGANALLAARRAALAGKQADTAAELRRELAKAGVVVREDRAGQHWRLVSRRR